MLFPTISENQQFLAEKDCLFPHSLTLLCYIILLQSALYATHADMPEREVLCCGALAIGALVVGGAGGGAVGGRETVPRGSRNTPGVISGY